MKFKPFLITLLCVLTFTILKAGAQDNSADLTPSHLQAAEKYLIATGVDKKFDELTTTMINAFTNRMPETNRAAFTDVMMKFMHKYFTWEQLKPDLSKLYATEFTEAELNQLTDFFYTPVGKKYGEKSVQLFQKSMVIGQQLVKDHQQELQQMIKEAIPADKN